MYGEWVANRKITYVITFGDTGSGSSGGGWTGDDKDGDGEVDPVFTLITLTAKVADWDAQDVYLQSVNFANSAVVTDAVISTQTNQLQAEVENNPQKLYNATFTFSGAVNEDATISTSFMTNKAIKWMEGSTVTFDFTGTFASTKTIHATAPAGWELDEDGKKFTFTKKEITELESGKLNSFANNRVYTFGTSSFQPELSANATWDWSDNAKYKFAKIATSGEKFTLNFANVTMPTTPTEFGITLKLPAGYKVSIGGGTATAATAGVIINSTSLGTTSKTVVISKD